MSYLDDRLNREHARFRLAVAWWVSFGCLLVAAIGLWVIGEFVYPHRHEPISLEFAVLFLAGLGLFLLGMVQSYNAVVGLVE